MNFRSAFAVLSMTVALTACGQLPFQQSEPEAPAHSGPPTVSPLDQPIETGAEAIPVSTAEARVGRPLTPVSVAGVARRSARRCAAGVYNC